MPDISSDEFSPASAPTMFESPTGHESDSFGSRTAAAGTPIIWVVPPLVDRFARVDGFYYHNLAAALQTLSVMVTLQSLPLIAAAKAGQQVIEIGNGSVLNPTDNTAIAANDWIVVRNEINQWQGYRINGISTNTITIDKSVGDADANGFVKAIPLDPGGSTVFFMGAPADHSKRQYIIPSNPGQPVVYNPPNGIGTSPISGQPILVYSGNVTTDGYLAISYSQLRK